MNAGVRIPPFVESLTGISNAMVQAARPAAVVMMEVADFVGNAPLLAHNASFDRKFWDYELGRVGIRRRQEFACSLLLSRRLLPDAPNHKLGTLTAWAKLPATGQAHRALADAEMAANLLGHLVGRLRTRHGLNTVTHELLCQLQQVPAAKLDKFFATL
jgi:DNA polymerase-3 subunit epsilon